MGKRSLQVSPEGIRIARQAFKRKGWTQEFLAGEAGLETRQPIWKFFTGKPVDRQVFHEICLLLEVNPEEIVQKDKNFDFSPVSFNHPNSAQVLGKAEANHQELPNSLIQKVRLLLNEKIQHQCGSIRLLDIAHPLALEDVYVDVNILEEISSQRWLDMDRLQKLKSNNFDRFGLSKIAQERVAGVDILNKHSRLMVLGKPGSGKTTFLQAIALHCNQKKILSDYAPIFIGLKSFAENERYNSPISLFKYIQEECLNSQITEAELNSMLHSGKTLILLDGLDEVSEDISDKLKTQISHFTDKFYKNRIVITCRIAAQAYKFKGFTEVEIADLTKSQITTFVYQWFVAVGKTSFFEGKALAERFIQQLELPENLQIRELATTPLLLSITCLVFHALGNFPSLRSELYKQGLELLLVRWDETRGVKRDEIYRNLSLLHKIKLLSNIASTTFLEEDYFFSETRIEQLIINYLQSLPQSPSDNNALLLDSHSVLKAIEAQHGLLVERARGIYSFSHLTFHEYLTARDIVVNVNSNSLDKLVVHISEKRWREVFLLTAGMLPSPNNLFDLMQQQVKNLAQRHPELQKLLNWVAQKSLGVSTDYHPAAVRAFYFTLALPPQHPLTRNQSLSLSLDSRLASNLAAQMSLDMALSNALAIALAITPDVFYQRLPAMLLALEIEHLLIDNQPLNDTLFCLRELLPNVNQDKQTLRKWWQAEGKTWVEELRDVTIDYCQIGYDWQLYFDDWKILEQYWDANKLLLDCLNSAGNTANKVNIMKI